MSLRKKVLAEYIRLEKQAKLLTNYRMQRIGRELYQFRSEMLVTINQNLPEGQANHQPISKIVRYFLDNAKELPVQNIQKEAKKLIETMAKFGTMRAAFVARKGSPPWKPVKIAYSAPDLGKLPQILSYQMDNMLDEVMRRINRGMIEKVPSHKIIQSVGSMFPKPISRERAQHFIAVEEDRKKESWAQTTNVFGEPPVEFVEGTFTPGDVEYLQDELVDAMNWSSRQYRPWFSDNVKSANRFLRSFEQEIMDSTVKALHDSEIQIGNDNLGIEDFEWVITKPQPKCDECCDRDGMTMKEIAEKIDDDFGTQPPPLHPNCRCRLIPQIKPNWAESTLKNAGYSWNPDEGLSFEPTRGQKSLGYDDMSWDDWLNLVRGQDE